MAWVADLIASIPEVNRWKLDKEIDFENKNVLGHRVQQHLERIAAVMTNWREDFATHLGLTLTDQSDIMERNHRQPGLQR